MANIDSGTLTAIYTMIGLVVGAAATFAGTAYAAKLQSRDKDKRLKSENSLDDSNATLPQAKSVTLLLKPLNDRIEELERWKLARSTPLRIITTTDVSLDDSNPVIIRSNSTVNAIQE